MRIAIIGTRNPNHYQTVVARAVTSTLTQHPNVEIVTGGAEGVDSIAINACYMAGAMNKLHLYLPWRNFLKSDYNLSESHVIVYNAELHKEWLDTVFKHHPAPERLSPAARKLHARNAGIILASDFVVAIPSDALGGGGTGQGIRLAQAYGVPCLTVPSARPPQGEPYHRAEHLAAHVVAIALTHMYDDY